MIALLLCCALIGAIVAQRPVVLEYQPNLGSFAGSGIHYNHVGNIIPPGPPWPSSPEGYQNFSSNPQQRPQQPPNLSDRFPEVTTNSPVETASNPNRPTFVGPGGINHNFVGQIIPPGKPWPSSPEGYQNFSSLNPQQRPQQPPNLSDRFPEVTTNSPVETASNPNRPTFVGPGGINHNFVGQIIPPGKPWPSSPEDYQNFSSLNPQQIPQQSPNLSDRFPEVTTNSPVGTASNPNRPTFIGPGGINHNFVGQIIPPGKPWPNSPEGYQNFSSINQSQRPNLKDIQNDDQFIATAVLTTTVKPTRIPAEQSTDLFIPLVHESEDSSTTQLPTTTIPSIDTENLFTSAPVKYKDNVIPLKPPNVNFQSPDTVRPQSTNENYRPTNGPDPPIKSEIPQTTYRGDLNNLDFFKPQFALHPTSFKKPPGINMVNVTQKPTIVTTEKNAAVTEKLIKETPVVTTQKPVPTCVKEVATETVTQNANKVQKLENQKNTFNLTSLLPLDPETLIELDLRVQNIESNTSTKKPQVPALTLLPPFVKPVNHGGRRMQTNRRIYGNTNYQLRREPEVYVQFISYPQRKMRHEYRQQFFF
ncbi:eukaryotic translation initiation factor 4 gamma [Aethina tumida]|uniref:eukaryotic translation initiation factor 4 gamma n=1 Tax=Aethina tumida TaxID=116153 RepID=UPI002148C64E|nr:eukaryotic translation initiation factor 4 gamma [Aethina tumida]